MWAGLLALLLVIACMPRVAVAQQLSFQRHGYTEGLSNLFMSCLLQDREGFLWMCSQNGMFRFDGTRFERWGADEGLADASVYAAALDTEGRLRVMNARNVYELRGKRFEPMLPAGALKSRGIDRSLVFLGPHEGVLVASGRLYRIERAGDQAPWALRPFFTDAELAAEPALGDVMALASAPDGGLWFGCGTQLCEWRAGRLLRWSEPQGVPSSDWCTLFFDRDGGLWVRSSTALLMRPPGAAGFVRRDPPDLRVDNAREWMPLAQDTQGRVLVRTRSGIARWSDGRWESFGAAQGLSDEIVSAMLVDADGAIWLGRQGRGLDRWLGYGQWTNWGKAQGIAGDSWAMAREAGGDLLIGTGGGCRRLSPGAVSAVDCGFEGLPSGEVIMMTHLPDGSIVLAPETSSSEASVYRVRPGQRKAEFLARVKNLYEMAADAQGRLWLASLDGVKVLEPVETGSAGPARIQAVAGLETTSTSDVSIGPDGSMWLVGAEGLVRLRDGRVTRFAVQDPTGGRSLRFVAAAADGSVWAATRHRVVHLRVEGERIVAAQWMDTPLLKDVGLSFVRTDPGGRVWLGTEHGLVFHDGARWRRVDQTDGLVWNDVNTSFHVDADGSVWVGTSGGLSHVHNLPAPPPADALRVSVVSAQYGASALQVGAPNARPWGADAALSVRLAALSPAWSGGALFRYRIVGLSDEWFDSRVADVRLPALQPGDYRLEAMAVNEARALQSPALSLPLSVIAPWWRAGWFHALSAVAVALAFGALWRWRAHVLSRRQHELERLLERATRDPLTGLWNRATILDMLSLAIMRARTQNEPLAIALIDLDHFKDINDAHGHLGGDEVLRTLGRSLAQGAREGDALGRYGGEELLLVMPGLPKTLPSVPVERLQQLVGQIDCRFGGHAVRVTASVGVEWLGPDAADAQTLIGRADRALYAAKSAGRNRVVYAAAGERVLPDGEPALGPA